MSEEKKHLCYDKEALKWTWERAGAGDYISYMTVYTNMTNDRVIEEVKDEIEQLKEKLALLEDFLFQGENRYIVVSCYDENKEANTYKVVDVYSVFGEDEDYSYYKHSERLRKTKEEAVDDCISFINECIRENNKSINELNVDLESLNKLKKETK